MAEPSPDPSVGASLTTAGVLGRALVAFAVYIMAGGLAFAMFRVPSVSSNLVGYVEGAVQATLVGIAALFVYTAHAPPAVSWRVRGLLGRAAITYAIFFAVWLPFAMFLYPAWLQQIDVQLQPQPTLKYFAEPYERSRFGPLSVLTMACLLVPAAEEILFRGHLQEVLKRFVPTGVAVALTAGVFGLFHGLEYALPIGLLGVLFGVLKERSGSLMVPIFAHILHNSITIGATVIYPQFYSWIYGE